MRRVPWTIWIALLAAAANIGWIVGDAGLTERMATWLQFDRAALTDGQLWRLVTCHFVHWSAVHFWLDLLPWVALGLIFERQVGRRVWLAATCVGAAAIGLGVWLGQPRMSLYRGWSGLDNTAVVLGWLVVWRSAGDWRAGRARRFALLGLAGVYFAKLSAEAFSGAATFSLPMAAGMGAATPIAHWLGAAAGLATWLAVRLADSLLPRCEGVFIQA
ncbi:MAG: hypothetical protein BIFFINMI_02562 [Phycisphaerae bacterium]|nr:hypothetical protein [Phycisphaerae bacterium]